MRIAKEIMPVSYTHLDVYKRQSQSYSVQVGAFRNRQLAESLNLQLRRQGFPSRVVMEDNLFKVRVGDFRTLDNAVAMAVSYTHLFIPLHCYYGTYGGAAGANTFLKEVVDATYNMYHKPIWITEFAVSGWGYSNASNRKQVEAFLKTAIEGLNKRSYVERYSWFSFNTTDNSNGASALWTNSTGKLDVYKRQGISRCNISNFNCNTCIRS